MGLNESEPAKTNEKVHNVDLDDATAKWISLEDFAEAAEGTIVRSDYDLAGSYVITPYGLRLLRLAFDHVQQLVEFAGYETYEFPSLIKSKYIELQKKLFDFESGMVFVTKFGKKQVEPLAMKSDSTLAICSIIQDLIKSGHRLPLRIADLGYFIRKPRTGRNMPFLTRFGYKNVDCLAFFDSENEANIEITRVVKLIEDLFRKFAVPVVCVKRPLHGNYPIANLTVGFDTALPSGGAIQCSSLYNHGSIFTSLFGISHIDRNGKKVSPSHTSWGITERIIGLMLLYSMDSKGFVILPEFSPIQVVIIPHPALSLDGIRRARSVLDTLQSAQLRVELDETRLFLPKKFARWEKLGVPLRIEIGNREMTSQTVTAVRRDSGIRVSVMLDELLLFVKGTLDDISKFLRERALHKFSERLDNPSSLDDLRLKSDRKKIQALIICETEVCRNKVRESCRGEILGEAYDGLKVVGCIVCGKPGKLTYFSDRY